MGVFFYNIFLQIFGAGTRIAALFNPKAKKWVTGRKDIFRKLEAAISPSDKVIWMHCASLGEFEQGRPLLESIRKQYPVYKILLTFFSPSGYEVKKNYEGADFVFYLPLDGPANARRFLEITHPSLVIFVKYEFWYYYLKKIKYRNIPLLLVSAIFRPDMSFFKWYGGLQRKILSRFDHLFVQNQSSKDLIQKIGLADLTSVSGDTRFDRVVEIAANAQAIPAVASFMGKDRVLIAGSTWPDDEVVLQKMMAAISDQSLKLVIAPHEVNEKHIQEIERLFPGAARYSSLVATPPANQRVLIIDNVGMLSRLYQYAWVTYVGGGLKTGGVHNVLEAAVYDKIVFFGPYFQKYSEAIGLFQTGGAISFTDDKKDGVLLAQLVDALLKDEEDYKARSKAAGSYVRSNTGATEKIIRFIQEKRLLTS